MEWLAKEVPAAGVREVVVEPPRWVPGPVWVKEREPGAREAVAVKGLTGPAVAGARR